MYLNPRSAIFLFSFPSLHATTCWSPVSSCCNIILLSSPSSNDSLGTSPDGSSLRVVTPISPLLQDLNQDILQQQPDQQQDEQPDEQQEPPYWQGIGFIGTQCLFPFPGQNRAPYFDRKNITQFLTMWEDLTLELPKPIKIKKIPPYCKDTIGKYIRTLPSFGMGNWASFKAEVLSEFKDDDEEQQKYIVAYLRKSVQQIRKTKDTDYRAFILDFTEKSQFLIKTRKLDGFRRVTLFLHAFSDEVGNKLYKRCGIELDDLDTINRVFNELKREVLDLCIKEES